MLAPKTSERLVRDQKEVREIGFNCSVPSELAKQIAQNIPLSVNWCFFLIAQRRPMNTAFGSRFGDLLGCDLC